MRYAERKMRFSYFLIGLTSVVAQIVLVRELMEAFNGNEISLGLMLAAWLLWTAVGSGLVGRLFADAARPALLLAGLQIAVAAALPLTILAVRTGREALHLLPGEIPGPGTALITCLTTLGLFCMISGWQFAVAARLRSANGSGLESTAPGYVYWLETGGSAVGGVAASLLLVPRLDPFTISLLLSLLNLAAAARLTCKRRWVGAGAIFVLGILFAGYIIPTLAPYLEQLSEEGLWPGMRLVAARHSNYGHLVLLESEGSHSLFENGLILAHFPDPQGAEESVHYALAQSPKPRRVLLIGGGINGGLVEALKHPDIETVDYVESDPALLDLVRVWMPRIWLAGTADPRVRMHPLDGRLFLKNAALPYDVIIINLPDPQTAQLNRFYTLEFFQEAVSKLAPQGVFSFRLSGAENYISPDLAAFLRCIHKTLGLVFPQVFAMPGDTVYFFAAGQHGKLVRNSSELLRRIQSRGVDTIYAGSSMLNFRMSADRLRDLEEQIAPRPETPVNRDFVPVAYYLAVSQWSGRFHSGYREIPRMLAAVPFAVLLGGLGLTALVLGMAALRISDSTRQLRLATGSSVAAMGFALMGLEVLLLLAFQAVFGFVYVQLALLISAIMSGMTIGAWYGLSNGKGHEAGMPADAALKGLWRIQLVIAAWAPLQCLCCFMSASSVGAFSRLVFSHGLYPAMALLTGMLGGYQFILASRVFYAQRPSGKGGLGLLYALDLAGSCAGALLLSLYLIPVYGFLQTSLWISLLNLAPAALLIVWRSRQP